MYLKHKYNISNTYKSFVRYFQIYRKTIKFELYKYESHKMIFSEEDVEDYVENGKFLQAELLKGIENKW